MKLEHEIVTLIKVKADNVSKLISEHYNKPYEIEADMEWSNSESHTFSVSKSDRVYSWNVEAIERFKKTGYYQSLLPALLQDLCWNDIIDEGTYLIEVNY